MAIEGRSDAVKGGGGRVRLGMVGGGEGAFIGAVHRLAARMDGITNWSPGRCRRRRRSRAAPARRLGSTRLRRLREHGEGGGQARRTGSRRSPSSRPNHVHAGPALAFLKAGMHVICDKPLTLSLAEARKMKAAVAASGRIFALTHNYTGYPLVRRAREMVQAGELGEIRLVQVEYPQEWLTGPTETTGNKQAEWRVDPARSGAGGALGDIGTHAYNLADYIVGLEVAELACDLTSFGAGRALDDNVQMKLRYANGARGALWASQVAPGNENGLRIRVYGTKAGLTWVQAIRTRCSSPARRADRDSDPRRAGFGTGGCAGDARAVGASRRIPGGVRQCLHGRGFGDQSRARPARSRRRASMFPTIEDGVKGLAFIEAAVKSSKANGRWVKP